MFGHQTFLHHNACNAALYVSIWLHNYDTEVRWHGLELDESDYYVLEGDGNPSQSGWYQYSSRLDPLFEKCPGHYCNLT